MKLQILFFSLFFLVSVPIQAQNFEIGPLTAFPSENTIEGLGINFNAEFPFYQNLSITTSVGGLFAAGFLRKFERYYRIEW